MHDPPGAVRSLRRRSGTAGCPAAPSAIRRKARETLDFSSVDAHPSERCVKAGDQTPIRGLDAALLRHPRGTVRYPCVYIHPPFKRGVATPSIGFYVKLTCFEERDVFVTMTARCSPCVGTSTTSSASRSKRCRSRTTSTQERPSGLTWIATAVLPLQSSPG